LELPGDASVKVAPELDAICRGCFIGNHCDAAIGVDSKYARAIRATAEARGISDSVNETEGTVTLRSGIAVTAPIQRMSAGIAREIFSDPNYQLRIARNSIGYAGALLLRAADRTVTSALERLGL
jgi:hypothetical protein